jgi:hypothetical protein
MTKTNAEMTNEKVETRLTFCKTSIIRYQNKLLLDDSSMNVIQIKRDTITQSLIELKKCKSSDANVKYAIKQTVKARKDLRNKLARIKTEKESNKRLLQYFEKSCITLEKQLHLINSIIKFTKDNTNDENDLHCFTIEFRM